MITKVVGRIRKDPDEIKDFTFNFGPTVARLEDPIVDAKFAADAGLEITGSQFSDSDATIWLGTLTIGSKYAASALVTLASGRKLKQAIQVTGISKGPVIIQGS